jgi:hypothetical protein
MSVAISLAALLLAFLLLVLLSLAGDRRRRGPAAVSLAPTPAPKESR